MRPRSTLGILYLLAATPLAMAAALPVRRDAGKAPAPQPVRFAQDIRPLLSDNCFKCHGPDGNARMANLRLDTEASARRAFVPGSPEKSPSFLRITAKDPARRMPPPGSNHTLTPAQIALIRRWIVEGARWEKHWAFVPPVRPTLPAVRNAAWPKNPIDRFILARLEKTGLKPSPPASKETLLRRVTLDLSGLPPTLAELDGFLADKSPDATEKAVDRLLRSPRFGERMAWDWLEGARYADTNGYQEDRTRTMWPWRDWVIHALNTDLPFDRFTVAQIAGDLLPNATVDQKIATGFNRNHMLNGEGGRIPEESRVEYVGDRVDTTATVFLGLTAACARCHDHKYDPVTQREYYQLSAYFNNLPESGAVDRGGNANPVLPLPTEEQKARIAALEKSLGDLDGRIKATTNATARAALETEREAARKSLDEANNAVLVTMVMAERPTPRDTFILAGGAYDRLGEKVGVGVPAALPPLPPGAPNNRLGFARWLVDAKNPLTARVAVNHLWQTLFGTGLVKTSEDFGVQGESPSHPELLDWLATEFVRQGWSVKRIIKLMVTSAAYRQSSRVTPGLLEKDPENRLLARGPRYRLPAPVLRDQALAFGGLLVEKVGGPPVKPYQPEGVWEDFSYGKIVYAQDHGEDLYRRSIYTFWRRSVGPTTLFDTAARRNCTVRQTRTNTPLQALTLLNDVTFVEAARALAQRVMIGGGRTPEARIATAFRIATSRRPTPKESAILVSGFRRNLARYQSNREAAAKLVGVGESPRRADLDVAELAATTGVTALILNLDEVISKE